MCEVSGAYWCGSEYADSGGDVLSYEVVGAVSCGGDGTGG